MELEKKIKRYAKEIGIGCIGFTSADAFTDLQKVLVDRRDKGYLTGLEEQDIEKRVNPKMILHNAKTIIAVVIPYYVQKESSGDSSEDYYGEMAIGTFGRDYHMVLKEKLEQLMLFIKTEYGDFAYKIFVDTGPLSDRDVAHRAGLGWFGKNNLLITEDYGSWVYIGYVVTDLELQHDVPLEKECLNCNLCVEACPSGALEKNYLMNGKRCLSYITQTKNPIEEVSLKRLENKIYGCDVCQMVCPHNHRVSETSNKDFFPIEGCHKLKLTDLVHMTNKQFRETVGKTAGGWRGKNVIRRNAVIAMGNSKDTKMLPHLNEVLQDESPMIRKYAGWAILQICRDEGTKILREHVKKEKSSEVATYFLKLLDGDDHS